MFTKRIQWLNRLEYTDDYDMILSLDRYKAKMDNPVTSLGRVSGVSSNETNARRFEPEGQPETDSRNPILMVDD